MQAGGALSGSVHTFIGASDADSVIGDACAAILTVTAADNTTEHRDGSMVAVV